MIADTMIALDWTMVDSRSKASGIRMGQRRRMICRWPVDNMACTAADVANTSAVVTAADVPRSADRWCMHSTTTTASNSASMHSTTAASMLYCSPTATLTTTASTAAALSGTVGVRRVLRQVAQQTQGQDQTKSDRQFS